MINGNELLKYVNDSLVELTRKTEEKKNSAEIRSYLDFMAKFHHYSLNNTFLIWAHRPDANLVKGFRQWNDLNRYVRKGEHGIPILAPVFKKHKIKDDLGQEKEEEYLAYFMGVYVFDVKQTEGEALPKAPEISLAEGTSILDRLLAFANKRNIKVSCVEMGGTHHGTSYGGAIDIDSRLTEVRQSLVLLHEIAHELLHMNEKARKENPELTQRQAETEAETVAYTVARYFGIAGNSEVYLSLWQPEPKQILESFKRIHGTIGEIIEGIEATKLENYALVI